MRVAGLQKDGPSCRGSLKIGESFSVSSERAWHVAGESGSLLVFLQWPLEQMRVLEQVKVLGQVFLGGQGVACVARSFAIGVPLHPSQTPNANRSVHYMDVDGKRLV